MPYARTLLRSLRDAPAIMMLLAATGCTANHSESGGDAGSAKSGIGGAASTAGAAGGTVQGGAGSAPGAGGTAFGVGGQAPAAEGTFAGAGSASLAGGTSHGAAGTSPGAASAGGADTASAGASAVMGPIECRTTGDGRTTLALVNGCSQTLSYAGSDDVRGSIPSGGHVCVEVGSDTEPLSAKRYWGYLGEDPGAEHHTLAEFTFNTDFNDFDWYNISHVDAHNLPMQIAAAERADCPSLMCADGLLAGCPEVGRWYGSDASLLACVSPERDNPESPVALWFEQCDDAYAWSGDDQNGEDPSPMRGVCAGEDYDVVFCPIP